MTTTGICKYCGQIRTIDHVRDEADEKERNEIASHECDCEGAKAKRDLDYRIQSGKRAIEQIVTRNDERAGNLFMTALDNVARGVFLSVSVESDTGVRYRISRKGNKVKVESAYTEKHEADGEAIDD